MEEAPGMRFPDAAPPARDAAVPEDAGPMTDGGEPVMDAGVPPMMDATPAMDSAAPPTDASVPPPDSPVSQCAHSPCQTGGPLAASCAPGVAAVCNVDFYCCYPLLGSWDQSCVNAYNGDC